MGVPKKINEWANQESLISYRFIEIHTKGTGNTRI
jgi:hypothetical protein